MFQTKYHPIYDYANEKNGQKLYLNKLGVNISSGLSI